MRPLLVEHAVTAFVDAVVFVDLRVRGAERRDLDDLVAETHVREMKAPADQPAVAKQRRTSSGCALVAMSKSLGCRPSSRSRTAPPTRNAW